MSGILEILIGFNGKSYRMTLNWDFTKMDTLNWDVLKFKYIFWKMVKVLYLLGNFSIFFSKKKKEKIIINVFLSFLPKCCFVSPLENTNDKK
jgi:hypothetical protein